MALQKQKVQLSIVAGIDTKTDEKNVAATSFLELDNVDFTKTGSLKKRNGYQKISSDIASGGSISSGNAIATFKEELLQYSTDKLYSYSEAEEKWLEKGSVTAAATEAYSVISDGSDAVDSNFTIASGIAAYTYSSSSASFNSQAVLVDNTTGTVLSKLSLNTTGSVRVEALYNRFFFIFITGGNICFQYVDAVAPTVLSSTSIIGTASGTLFDAEVIGARIFVLWRSGLNANISYIELPSTSVSPITTPCLVTTDRFTISKENVNNVRVGFCSSGGTGVTSLLYNYSLSAQLQAPVTVFAGLTVVYISSIQNATNINASDYIVSYVTGASAVETIKSTIDNLGNVTSPEVVFYKVGIQSKPVLFNGLVYFMGYRLNTLPDPVQTGISYYLFTTDGRIVARFERENGLIRFNLLVPSLRVENDTICFAAEGLTEFQNTNSSVTVPTAVKKYCAEFSTVKNYFDSEVANTLNISGGVVKMYDGETIVEQGFLEAPSANISAVVAATGGPQGVGNSAGAFPTTVQYCQVLAWRDRFGQIYRSAPGPVYTVTIANNSQKVTHTFYPYALTEKENIEIELYRTEALGTVFYKCSGQTFATRIVNNPSAPTQTYEDSLTDTALISNETLYTTGGVLENDSPDSSKYLVTFKNRLFSLTSDGKELQYSKLIEQNGPVEFNAAFKIKLDSRGGVGTSLAVLDDNLIIFKERAIFAMTGEGPNNLGEQDDYRQPQLLTSDAGCSEPNSVCNSSEGVFFKSEKGIYILRRGLAVEYIGAPVEKYNDMVITSGTLIADVNQVRFTTEAGKALVFDYFHRMWSTYSNIKAVDATNYGTNYVFVTSAGNILKETVGVYKDIASYIKISIVSSWIQLAGIQGFERFYKMMILGTYKTAHKLKVAFAYNFNPNYKQEVDIDTADTINPTVYGTGTYGTESPYGGSYPLYQFEIRPKIQKCQSFKFKIEDSKTTTDGEAFTISNFAAIIGIKDGLTTKSDSTTYAAK